MKKVITILQLTVLATGALLGTATYAQQAPVPYPETNPNLISRVGSLLLASNPTLSVLQTAFWGSSGSPLFSQRCEGEGNTNTASESCLQVNGVAAFPELITHKVKAFINKAYVGPAGTLPTSSATTSLILADTGTGHDSIMVSDLGRFNASNQFEPVDKTTMRGVCAAADGTLEACALLDSANASSCPLTFTDPESGRIYPIVDANGACWFAKDLVRNQLNQTLAGQIFEAPTQFSFKRLDSTSNIYSISDYRTHPDPAYGSSVEVHGWNTFSMPAVLKNFIISTCGWDTPVSGATIHSTYTASFFYSAAYATDAAKIYDLVCESFHDDIDDTTSHHGFIYSVNEPTTEYLTSATPGPFFFAEDIGDNTCPSGWHVPLHSEWMDLKTAITTSATDAGTAFHEAPLAKEINFINTVSTNPAMTNPSWASAGTRWDGSRYYSRDRRTNETYYSYEYDVPLNYSGTVIGVGTRYLATFTQSWDLLNSSGHLNFDTPWQKTAFTASSMVVHHEPFALKTTPTSIFASLAKIFFKEAFALPPDNFSPGRDSKLGKVRCVKGAQEAQWMTSGWGTCTEIGTWSYGGGVPVWHGTGTYQQTRSLSCFIASEEVNYANCTDEKPSLTRSCTPIVVTPPSGGGGAPIGGSAG